MPLFTRRRPPRHGATSSAPGSSTDPVPLSERLARPRAGPLRRPGSGVRGPASGPRPGAAPAGLPLPNLLRVLRAPVTAPARSPAFCCGFRSVQPSRSVCCRPVFHVAREPPPRLAAFSVERLAARLTRAGWRVASWVLAGALRFSGGGAGAVWGRGPLRLHPGLSHALPPASRGSSAHVPLPDIVLAGEWPLNLQLSSYEGRKRGRRNRKSREDPPSGPWAPPAGLSCCPGAPGPGWAGPTAVPRAGRGGDSGAQLEAGGDGGSLETGSGWPAAPSASRHCERASHSLGGRGAGTRVPTPRPGGGGEAAAGGTGGRP